LVRVSIRYIPRFDKEWKRRIVQKGYQESCRKQMISTKLVQILYFDSEI
jgi:hypothetical protein